LYPDLVRILAHEKRGKTLGGEGMADNAVLKKKADELGERVWDVDGLKARIRKFSAEGIPRKNLVPKEMLSRKQEILDRVQRRAEEYNFILKNCAQGPLSP
jgi:hypothetical protein